VSRVLFWTASEDGSSWYRATLPAETFQWSGHHIAVTSAASSDLALAADVVIGSRIANEGASRFWQNLARVPVDQRPRLVLDIDDAYFALDPSNPAAGAWGAAQLDRLAANMAAADIVTVASEGLREHVLKHAADVVTEDVRVVPNGLHAGWLGTPRDYGAGGREIIVGWSGTASSARDFDLAVPALARAVEYGDGEVKLRLIGLPFRHPSADLLRRRIPKRLHDRVEAVQWVQHGSPYLSACAEFDIWVAPYRPDEFVESKFPTKALEAGTLGIPLITSDVRPYREWFDGADPMASMLVDEHKPWMWGRYLKTLIDSANTRRASGEAARSRAALNVLQSVGHVWSDVCRLNT
jgi:glycosyltransferase involved in cell wall biosynthesis